jgi:glycosyltransferase involved in cell wall biosynthesis
MRIAVVTTSWPARQGDPAGHFVQTEARALERSGHEVVVLAPEPGGAFGWPGVAARVRHRPIRALEAARWVAIAHARLVRMSVDRVVAHWAVPCGWPIAGGARAALEVVSHGGDVRLMASMPEPGRRLIVRAIASRAERWRFVSEALMAELIGRLDWESRRRVERVAVVQAASIEMPDVSGAMRLRRAAFGGRRLAVSVGRLVSSKRVDAAIEHVARSRESYTLVIVGDGPERDRLERLAIARRVDARFVGQVARSEALAWIGAADVLLQASRTEGSSTVQREAAALGTRVEQL